MDVENVEVAEFGMAGEKPGTKQTGATRNWGKAAQKEMATGRKEDILVGESLNFGSVAGIASAENFDGMTVFFESGFLSVDTRGDAAS